MVHNKYTNMDLEEDEMRDHRDEEFRGSPIGEEFAKIYREIKTLETMKSSTHNRVVQDKIEKAIALLRLHVQNYQHIIIFNRRRARQRLRRRQCTLRNFFLQALMETQIRFAEILPLAVEPRILLETNLNSNQHEERNSEKLNILDKGDKNVHSVKDLSYYNDVVSKFTNDQWLDTFHMSRNIFKLICNRLKISLDNINMDLENWIAMCIYMFASGNKFCSVAMLFNVEKKFVRQSLFKFSECLLNEFSEKISMPNDIKELEAISNNFQKASNMPSVAGVLSLFKVPNVCGCGPSNNCGSECIKVQVCIDNNLLFRKVETTSHKPTMFLRSPNEISLFSKKLSEDCEVPYFIVAPDYYPLRNWLMQKYQKPYKSWEYNFNKSCGSLNFYREVSLKRLFGRWHILNLPECILPESKSFIIKACCLLHNILEENKECFLWEWCTKFYPSRYECRLTTSATEEFIDIKTAMDKRNLIAKLIRTNNV